MITLYSQNNCVKSIANRMLLNAKRIPFVEKNIDENTEHQLELQNFDHENGPVIVVKDEHLFKSWQGFDPELISQNIIENI